MLEKMKTVYSPCSCIVFIAKDLSDVQIVIKILKHHHEHCNWNLLKKTYKQLKVDDSPREVRHRGSAWRKIVVTLQRWFYKGMLGLKRTFAKVQKPRHQFVI